jgi:hypothetical protein
MNEYLDKLRSVGTISHRSGDRVVEGHDEHGHRTKATTDEQGNTVVEHNTRDDRVDVTVRPTHIHVEGEAHGLG